MSRINIEYGTERALRGIMRHSYNWYFGIMVSIVIVTLTSLFFSCQEEEEKYPTSGYKVNATAYYGTVYLSDTNKQVCNICGREFKYKMIVTDIAPLINSPSAVGSYHGKTATELANWQTLINRENCVDVPAWDWGYHFVRN